MQLIIELPLDILMQISMIDEQTYSAMLAIPSFARSLGAKTIEQFKAHFGYKVEHDVKLVMIILRDNSYINSTGIVINADILHTKNGLIHNKNGLALYSKNNEPGHFHPYVFGRFTNGHYGNDDMPKTYLMNVGPIGSTIARFNNGNNNNGAGNDNKPKMFRCANKNLSMIDREIDIDDLKDLDDIAQKFVEENMFWSNCHENIVFVRLSDIPAEKQYKLRGARSYSSAKLLMITKYEQFIIGCE